MVDKSALLRDIFNTLPTGYYLGTRANVKLDEDGVQSYCSPVAKEIHIGGRLILDCLDKANNNVSAEQLIRTLLYHECAHLLLTPEMNTNKMKMFHDVINIFEDERIEVILKDHFIGTNFKDLVFRVNWTPDWKPTNAIDYFFGIVRFRQGPKAFVDRVQNIIKKFWCINATYICVDHNDVDRYLRAVTRLWEDVCQDWKDQQNEQEDNQDKNQNKQDSNQNKKDDSEKNNTSNGSNKEKESKAEEDESSETVDSSSEDQNDEDGDEEEEGEEEDRGEEGGESGNADEGDAEEEVSKAVAAAEKAVGKGLKKMPEFTRDTAKSVMKNIFESFIDTKMLGSLERIIVKNAKRQAMRVGANNRYSGAIDLKSVAVRNDYRWFVRSGDNGNKFNRTHITLWVDCSGSFKDSTSHANKLLNALNTLESRIPEEFSFDVVSMNECNTIHNKKAPLFACGCNNFGPDVPNIFKKTNRPGWDNYNIAVWDGDMFSCWGHRTPLKEEKEAFDLLNNKHTIIVSDSYNSRYLDVGCPKARRTYIDRNYCKAFVDTVLETLDRALG